MAKKHGGFRTVGFSHLLSVTLAVAAISTAALPGTASAEFPEKPIEMIVPTTAGGGLDLFGRTVAKVLNEQNIVTERIQVTNIPGASGSIGIAKIVDERKADPYTLLGVALHVHLAPLTLGTPYSYKDLTPIAKLFSEYELMVVRADSPIKSLKDIADKLKQDVGSVTFGGGPIGNTDHITVAKFAAAVGGDPTKITFVPYAGSEITVAILGGHVDVGMGGVDLIDLAEAGQIRILGISSKERLPGRFKDVPTFVEQGYDVLLQNWRGIFAAPGISDAETQYWKDAMTKMVQTDAWKAELAKNQWTDAFEVDTFPASLDAEHEEYRKLLGTIGLLK